MQTIDLKQEGLRAALEAIAARHDGYLNPREIVEAARDPDSSLHGYFEWDDSLAAEHYRIAQAGALIRRVKVTIVRPPKEDREIEVTTTRAFQSRPSQRGGKGGYESIKDIVSDPVKREELKIQITKELMAYRRRYAEVVALSGVWEQIDLLAEDLGLIQEPTCKPVEHRPQA